MHNKLQAWWAHKQGLDGSLQGRTAADVLAATGWSRSVGGVTPYLAVWTRSGLGRAAVDAELAAIQIHELPAARGCTYVVPAVDYGLALRAGSKPGDSTDVHNAKKFMGVTTSELEALTEALLAALERGPMGPDELKATLGNKIRALGEVGRKRGINTTLPLVIGTLQGQGRIRRIPTNGRLDQQRYQYALWTPSPVCTLSQSEVCTELARRFFRWIGPATVAQFAWWSGLSIKPAKAAMAPLGLVAVEGGLLLPEDADAYNAFKTPKTLAVTLVGSLDNQLHLRREVSSLLDPSDTDKQVWSEKGTRPVGGLSDIEHHAILEGGRLIGFWDYDEPAKKVVWSTFGSPPSHLAAAVKKLEAYVREELSDARTFSLDSPESRVPRLAALRQ